jgi:hypothetical protein
MILIGSSQPRADPTACSVCENNGAFVAWIKNGALGERAPFVFNCFDKDLS